MCTLEYTLLGSFLGKNNNSLKKITATAWGLCGRMRVVRIWEKGVNSMKNKNPLTVKTKSLNKAKAGGRWKWKKIGFDD